MNKKLNVLCLLQYLDDFRIIQSELKNAGLDCNCAVAQSLQVFDKALQGAQPDLIIADYYLADGNGIDAFQIKKILAPHTPFIMIADSVGEDTAIEFMKMGVADYVRKEKINQIGPAIQRCLQIAAQRKQKKHAINQLREKARQLRKLMDLSQHVARRNNKVFRTLLQNSSDGICLVSAQGKILKSNPAALKILVMGSAQELEQATLDRVHPEDLSKVNQAFAQIMENPQQTITLECRIRQISGEYKWVEATWINQLQEPVVEAIVVNFRDITERKTAELELRESEAKLKKAQALGHCGSWEMNLVTGQSAWSDEIYRIFAFEDNTHEPSFESFLSFIHPEDLTGVMEIFDKAHATLANGSAMYRIQPLSGGFLYVVSDWQFDFDAQGKPVRIFGVLQDITKSKLSEIALSTSEARLRQAQAIGQMGSWEMDLLTGHTIWSDELFHIYGLNQSSTIPSMEAFKSVLHPDEAQQVIQFFEETSAVFRDASSSFRIRRADTGEIRHVNSVWQFEFDAQGKALKVFGIVQDITERKLAGQAQERSEKKYRDLFNLSPIPIWLFDADTLEFIDVNEAAITHYGYKREEFYAMTLKDLRLQEDAAKMENRMSSFHDQAHYQDVVRHVKKNGELIDVEINSRFLEIGGRKARMVLATDISERIRNFNALQQQNAKLREIAWTQSHVVRAPLARLMGLVNLLQVNDHEVDNAEELLNLIAVSAQELDSIIRKIVQKTDAVKEQTLNEV